MFGRRTFLWGGVVALITTATACNDDDNDIPTEPSEPPPQGPPNLEIVDLVVGTGAEAVNGSGVFIHYTLWRFDPNGADRKGERLESSRDPGNDRLPFTVGATNIIQGMSQGTLGMKVGGQRRLTVPPNLAYGATGDGSRIRPNEWLVFEIELLSVA